MSSARRSTLRRIETKALTAMIFKNNLFPSLMGHVITCEYSGQDDNYEERVFISELSVFMSIKIIRIVS